MLPAEPVLRPRLILETLVRSELRFVLIGGVAERLLGSPRTTNDLDVCPATDRQNFTRLARALNELEAAYRAPGLESGFPAPEQWSGKAFASFQTLALVTKFGWFDVVFRPDGTGGYRDLIQRASDQAVGELRVKVAHIDDLIHSKEAIGDPRYLAHLSLLRELREQLREGRRTS